MTIDNSRRSALFGFGSLVAGAGAYAVDRAHAATNQTTTAPGTAKLPELREQLRRSPRRRDFKTVPMILQQSDFWDDEALTYVISYESNRKQVWDNTEIAGPWLNLMRNALNAQAFAFRHPDFLAVSAAHGRHWSVAVLTLSSMLDASKHKQSQSTTLASSIVPHISVCLVAAHALSSSSVSCRADNTVNR